MSILIDYLTLIGWGAVGIFTMAVSPLDLTRDFHVAHACG